MLWRLCVGKPNLVKCFGPRLHHWTSALCLGQAFQLKETVANIPSDITDENKLNGKIIDAINTALKATAEVKKRKSKTSTPPKAKEIYENIRTIHVLNVENIFNPNAGW